ncbi:hypothetical protein BST91_08275 [Nonlabens tegetincola]|nr:hypothetical protein BST91_08275 [Nonlabens tegetincola]
MCIYSKNATMKKLLSLLIITLYFVISCEDQGMFYNDSSYPEPFSGDQYNEVTENPFLDVTEFPISTFSIDADGGSYSNVRRFLQQEAVLPPVNAVRTEEIINYFDMNYDDDFSTSPITINGEITSCPWTNGHKLARIGIKGKDIDLTTVAGSNYVFLMDVSGSMSSPDKLGLLKSGFKFLVDELNDDDIVSIVTYAGADRVVLDGAPGSDKIRIKQAIDDLGFGGGTAGARGIVTAYEIAQSYYINNGNNRVILGTDGDFNIGVSDQEGLIELIEDKKESGVFLTALGVGRGNLNEGTLEQLANKGNGTYEYIDKTEQLLKVFVHERNKFFTAAQDVKIQVEFSPTEVQSYRLIGYANRLLQDDQFEDDEEDAGEIGRGQSITAFYEIVPASTAGNANQPSLKVNLRYKEPVNSTSNLLVEELLDANLDFTVSSSQQKLGAAAASFGMNLRNSSYKGSFNYGDIEQVLQSVQLSDPHGYIQEFKELVQLADRL